MSQKDRIISWLLLASILPMATVIVKGASTSKETLRKSLNETETFIAWLTEQCRRIKNTINNELSPPISDNVAVYLAKECKNIVPIERTEIEESEELNTDLVTRRTTRPTTRPTTRTTTRPAITTTRTTIRTTQSNTLPTSTISSNFTTTTIRNPTSLPIINATTSYPIIIPTTPFSAAQRNTVNSGMTCIVFISMSYLSLMFR